MNNRLSPNIKPLRYRIVIEPIGPDYNYFNGICYILYRSDAPANKITINAVDLHFKDIYLVDRNKSYAHLDTINHEQTTLLLFDNVPLEGMLVIKYSGKIYDNPNGIFRTKEKDEWIFYTQFEPIHARKCFPCFDEPAFKSKFNINILAAKNKLVLSNTDVKNTIDVKGKTLHIFEETPPMSTYLVSFYVGRTNHIEGRTKSGTKVRIFSNKSEKYKKFIMNNVIKCMDIMTVVTGIEYTLSKLDIIYVSKFDAKGMENWGMIVIKDPIDETQVKLKDMTDFLGTIYHEIAHQWFGNLVTMQWWSDVWLHESFATWFSWYIMHIFHPELKPMEQFYIKETLSAFSTDYLKTSRPIRDTNHPITEDDFTNSNAYTKGSSLINMMVGLIGIESFISSIHAYFEKYQFKNVSTKDFLDCIEKASGKPINTFMKEWLDFNNYPIVDIDHSDVTQERYTLPHPMKIKQPWMIPVTDKIFLKQGSETINTDGYINVNGFFIANFHPTIIDKIIPNLNEPLDTAVMLNNLFMSLRSNKLGYDNYLNFWGRIIDRLLHVKPSAVITQTIEEQHCYVSRTIGNNTMARYRAILSKYVDSMLNILGLAFNEKTDTIDTLQSRISALNMASEINIPPYVEHLKKLFDRFIKSHDKENVIDPGTEDIVIKNAIINGSEQELNQNFSSVMDLFDEDADLVIENAPLTPIFRNYQKILDLIFSDKLDRADKIDLLQTAGQNRHHNKYLWTFIKENWNYVYETFILTKFSFNDVADSFEYMVDDSGDLRNDIASFFDNISIKALDTPVEKILEYININTNFSIIISTNPGAA